MVSLALSVLPLLALAIVWLDVLGGKSGMEIASMVFTGRTWLPGLFLAAVMVQWLFWILDRQPSSLPRVQFFLAATTTLLAALLLMRACVH